MRCVWCHNPESQNPYTEIMSYPFRCIECAKCVEACPQKGYGIQDGKIVSSREKCIHCGICAAACPSGARIAAGRRYSVDELMDKIECDRPFYEKSNGGVTISGGEPLLQIDFLTELLKALKKSGIHTAVDTAGCVPWESLSEILPYTDLFLYDIKAIDDDLHRKYVGNSNELILANLIKLNEKKARIFIRVPVIPGVNNTEKEISRIAEFISGMTSVELVELLPFNKIGGAKYDNLDINYPCADWNPLTKKDLVPFLGIFTAKGLSARVL